MAEARSEFAQFGADILTIVVVVAAISITVGIVTYLVVSLNNSISQAGGSGIPNYLQQNSNLLNMMILVLILGGVVTVAVWIIKKLVGTIGSIIPRR